MLVSVHHMTLKILQNHVFHVKTLRFYHVYIMYYRRHLYVNHMNFNTQCYITPRCDVI